MLIISEKSTLDECRWLSHAARAPRLRTMKQFAEQEIVLPNGPRVGRRYRCQDQPYAGLYFDEVDHGNWQVVNATGPSQSGKTLTCSVIPVLYHLFEVQETVIFGLPDMDMAGDKWREDLLPTIERTRYRELIPSAGSGSRGGAFNSIRFKHGATLRFMSGGGGDKSRAGFTSRVLVITETDGMDESGGGSEEADKIAQLFARTNAYDTRRKIYMECTLTTKQGRTWREHEAGTASRIAIRCPHCHLWVTPGREHLVGWQDAENVMDARESARFACPSCGALWTDSDRAAANAEAKLIHRGQEINEDGEILGPMPRTDTLGFRWTAANNLFASAGSIAAKEWNAQRADDAENKEKELCQFIWAMPYEDPSIEFGALDSKTLLARPRTCKRRELPEWTKYITVGIDVGKYGGHWTAIAWGEDARGIVFDYGVAEIFGERGRDKQAEHRAVLVGLKAFRDDYLQDGWLMESGERKRADYVLIDCRWSTEAVIEFCRESGPRVLPAMGYGATQRDFNKQSHYTHPKATGKRIVKLGDEYHIEMSQEHRSMIVNVNSDAWKSRVHRMLATAHGEPGSLELFAVTHQRDHTAFIKHLTNEREETIFVKGKGNVRRWVALSGNNHHLDSTMLSSVAGHLAGVRLVPMNLKKIVAQYETNEKKEPTWTIGR